MVHKTQKEGKATRLRKMEKLKGLGSPGNYKMHKRPPPQGDMRSKELLEEGDSSVEQDGEGTLGLQLACHSHRGGLLHDAALRVTQTVLMISLVHQARCESNL